MKKRILIIDDDMSLTHVVKLNLEATGDYEVQAINYAPHAIQAAHEFRPHLILLDYIMPDLDGGDISAILREDPQLARIPVVMVTALVSNREMANDGAILRNGHLMVAKPIRFEKLRHIIHEKLACREQESGYTNRNDEGTWGQGTMERYS